MPPIVATIVFCIGIVGLFWYTRDRNHAPSRALILPAFSLFVMSSRSITEWVSILTTGSRISGASQMDTYAEGTPLDRAVMIVLIALALIILLQRGKLVHLVHANLAIILFYLYAGVSVLWSDFPDITFRRWSRAVGILLMVFVILSERNRDAAMKRMFAWVGFITIPVSMLWIKYYPSLGRMMKRITGMNWQPQLIGVTVQKNELGAICLIFGIVFLSYFLVLYRDREHPDRKRMLRAYGAALAVLAWVFLKTNSVTAQTSFVLATLILIAARSRAVIRRAGMVHLMMLVLVGGPVSVLFLGLGSGLIQSLGRDATLSGRTGIWEKVTPLVHNSLLGTGFESFWLGPRLEYMQQGLSFPLNEAHNGYIEIFISLGWIGVLLLLVLLIAGYRNIIACYRRDPDAGALRLALFLCVVVSACTEATFRASGVGWFCFLTVTLLTGNEAWRPNPQRLLVEDEMETVPRELTQEAAS